jgi:hypothetical protein
MGLHSDHQSGSSWAPPGKTPVAKGTGKRFKTNMIAAVSNTGTLRFRVFGKRFIAPVFLDSFVVSRARPTARSSS